MCFSALMSLHLLCSGLRFILFKSCLRPIRSEAAKNSLFHRCYEYEAFRFVHYEKRCLLSVCHTGFSQDLLSAHGTVQAIVWLIFRLVEFPFVDIVCLSRRVSVKSC